MTRLRIFVVDDHALIREGVKHVIERHPGIEFAGEADNGQEASERILEARPDVALVDVSLPGLDGAQTTRLLKRVCPNAKVIALTAHEDRSSLREMLEAGASGYVLKRAACDELLHAIRTVAGGGIYIDPRLAGSMVSSFLQSDGEAPSAHTALTDREAKVLRRIAEGHSNKEIASELGLSIKTVETYKMRALDKLGLRRRVDIVKYAVKAGWLRER
jgi:DNA-binding NarL/FixJ family response regulator